MCATDPIITQLQTAINDLLTPEQRAHRDQLIRALLGGMRVIGRDGSYHLVAGPADPQAHRVLVWFAGCEDTRHEHCLTCSGLEDTETYYLLDGTVAHNDGIVCDHMLVTRLVLLDPERRAAALATDPALVAAWLIAQQGGCQPPTGLLERAARYVVPRAHTTIVAQDRPGLLSLPGEMGAAA